MFGMTDMAVEGLGLYIENSRSVELFFYVIVEHLLLEKVRAEWKRKFLSKCDATLEIVG